MANSKWQIANSGFTLIELLLVIALIGILTIVSLIGFTNYQQTQVFQTNASDVIEMVNLAKSRALTQVKPLQCENNGKVMQGYQIRVDPSGTEYQLEVICDASTYIMDTKNLPSGVTFTLSSQSTILFAVSTGVVNNPGTIYITGFGKTKSIDVRQTGIISVTDL